MTVINAQGCVFIETLPTMKKNEPSDISEDFLSLLNNKQPSHFNEEETSENFNTLEQQSNEYVNLLEMQTSESINLLEIKSNDSIKFLEMKYNDSINLLEMKHNDSINLLEMKNNDSINLLEMKSIESINLLEMKSIESINLLEMKSIESFNIFESKQSELTKLDKFEHLDASDFIEFIGPFDKSSLTELTTVTLLDEQSKLLMNAYLGNKQIETLIQKGSIEYSLHTLTNLANSKPLKNDIFEFSNHSSTVLTKTAPLGSFALGVESQNYSFLKQNLLTENNTLKLGTNSVDLTVPRLEPLASTLKQSSVKFNNYSSLIAYEFRISKSSQTKGENLIRNTPSFSVLFDHKWLEQNITIVREEDRIELWIRDFKSSKSRLNSLVSNLLNQLNNSMVNKVIVNGEVVINIKEIKNAN